MPNHKNSCRNVCRIPLYEALVALRNSQPSSFHVPGHKYGQALKFMNISDQIHPTAPSIGQTTCISDDVEGTFQKIMSIDVTELSNTDDLHMPEGVIAEAERLAATTFGAEETYFLVGGSTAGNLAVLLACCNPGDLIIVQRNVHKSVLNGLALAGARAVFVLPQKEASFGFDSLPLLSDIEEALDLYPDAKGVFVTNPTYYGVSNDLEPYAHAIHKRGKLLLVDEAHGAHYGQHPALPSSALQAGADAVVQSTHKTLTALTMGAMLHVQGERIDRAALKHALTIVQSSSPSYPIMASLDIARAMIDVQGPVLFEESIRLSNEFSGWVGKTSNLFEVPSQSQEVPLQLQIESKDEDSSKNENISGSVLSSVQSPNKLSKLEGRQVRFDPLRIVLKIRNARLTGYELLRELEKKGCWAEMADLKQIVLIAGVGSTERDFSRLKAALSEIEAELNNVTRNDLEANTSGEMKYRQFTEELPIAGHSISVPVILSRQKLSQTATEMIEIADAVGRTAAEAIIPYPPGVPILFPGELITQGIAEYIAKLALVGAKCQGVSDPSLSTIAVMKR